MSTHPHDLSRWQHCHTFDVGNPLAEQRIWLVLWITLATMLVEIIGGWWFGSMALLADGWHMTGHLLALGLSAFAYSAARRYQADRRFTFGTWKIEVLASYTSAILLAGVGLLMVLGSIERLLTPQHIHFQEALLVTVLGLLVNLVCAGILYGAQQSSELPHAGQHSHPHHKHGHGHGHGHGQDINMTSAYLHIVADAATSLLAIVALVGGWLYGWVWLDPLVALMGAALIMLWAARLLKSSGAVLLDRATEQPWIAALRTTLATQIENEQTSVADLHLWQVGRNAYALLLTLVTHEPSLSADQVRALLSAHTQLVHITVEINPCLPPYSSAA